MRERRTEKDRERQRNLKKFKEERKRKKERKTDRKTEPVIVAGSILLPPMSPPQPGQSRAGHRHARSSSRPVFEE